MNRIVNEAIELKDDDTQAVQDVINQPKAGEVVHINPWNAKKSEWNDAFIYGDACEAFDRLMMQQVQITMGFQFFGERPSNLRDTPKGQWKSTTCLWWQVVEGAPANPAKKQPTKGFSRHGVADRKDGLGYVPGVCDGGFRTKEAMSKMYAVGLDYDLNIDLDNLISRVEDLNLAGFLYTTFNNNTTLVTVLQTAAYKASEGDKVTVEGARAVLRDKGFDEEFLARVKLLGGTVMKDGKRHVQCSCPEITKIRLVVPLAEPVDLTELHADPNQAAEMYSARVRGLSQKIGFQHDTACEDPSRIFYVGAHPKTATGDDYYAAIFRAPPIRWDAIPAIEKPRKGGTEGGSTIPKGITVDIDGVTINVTDQYYRYGKRWNLTDIIPIDMQHGPSSDGEGEVITCPFHDKHTSDEVGTGTVVYEPKPDADASWKHYANIHCDHSCKSKYHLIHYLAEWLEQGLIDPADLEDAGYMVPLADGQDEKFCRPTPEEAMERASASAESNVDNDDLEARCGAYTKESKAAEIEGFLKDLFDEVVDVTDRNRVNEMLVKNTMVKLANLNKMWKSLDRVQAKMDKDKDKAKVSDDGSQIVFIDSDVDKQWEHGQAKLDAANAADPFLFEYMGELARVRRVEGKLRCAGVSEKHFRHHLNTHAPFYKRQGEDGKVRVMAPKDVAEHLFTRDHDHYQTLRRVTSLPFYTAAGELVREQGYHADSKVYLDMNGLELPPVPYAPTGGQVHDAKELLITEFADFPLGGKKRAEILQAIKGEAIPAVANAMALIIQPFVREMYDLTPAAVVNKPMPGTGASLLADCVHLIVDGTKATATPMPKNSDEMPKTLLSVLRSSGTYIFWDNINHEMDSAELAAAITGDPYSARILGVSTTLDIYVRAGMIFGANTLRMSDELRRRCYLINLDAGLERPEDRGGWHRDNIKKWITDHRADYVHAVLVLVNNWLAKGGTEFTDAKIASFEEWSEILGGILRDAGINGFLGNRDQLYEEVSDEKSTELYRLVAMMAAQARKDKNFDFRVGKQKKESRFIGILDLLNSRVDDEITLDDWNPKRLITGELEYNDTGTAGKRFKDAARNPYTVTFTEIDDQQVEWEVAGVVTFKAEKYRGDPYYGLLFEEKQRVPVPVENELSRRTR